MKRFGVVLALIVLVLCVVGFVQEPGEDPVFSLPELQVGAIVLAPIIVALVQVARKLGLPVKYAPYLNGLLALLGYGLVIAVGIFPASLEPVSYLLNALVVFLMAAGIYDRGQKSISPTKTRLAKA